MAFWSGEKLKEELAPLITGYDENAIDCAAYTLRIGNEIYISPDHKVEFYRSTQSRSCGRVKVSQSRLVSSLF